MAMVAVGGTALGPAGQPAPATSSGPGGVPIAATAAALAPTYAVFALTILPVGLAALTALTTANAMVQLRTDPTMHGAG